MADFCEGENSTALAAPFACSTVNSPRCTAPRNFCANSGTVARIAPPTSADTLGSTPSCLITAFAKVSKGISLILVSGENPENFA